MSLYTPFTYLLGIDTSLIYIYTILQRRNHSKLPRSTFPPPYLRIPLVPRYSSAKSAVMRVILGWSQKGMANSICKLPTTPLLFLWLGLTTIWGMDKIWSEEGENAYEWPKSWTTQGESLCSHTQNYNPLRTKCTSYSTATLITQLMIRYRRPGY